MQVKFLKICLVSLLLIISQNLFARTSTLSQYQIKDLGTFPGNDITIKKINDTGLIVGILRDWKEYKGSIFLYDNDETQFITPPDGYDVEDVFLNNKNQLLYLVCKNKYSDDCKTFLREYDGKTTDITTKLKGGQPHAFNDHGDILIRAVDNNFKVTNFIYKAADDSYIDLISPLTNIKDLQPAAFNNSDQVTGDMWSGNDEYGFVWDPNGNFLNFADLIKNNNRIRGIEINNKGDVLVATLGNQYIYHQNQLNQVYSSDNLSNLQDDGSALAGDEALYKNGEQIALHQLIVNLGDWDLLMAASVNAQGEIVGTGRLRFHPPQTHLFLMVPVSSQPRSTTQS